MKILFNENDYSEEEIQEFINKSVPDKNSSLKLLKVKEQNDWFLMDFKINEDEFDIEANFYVFDLSHFIKFVYDLNNLQENTLIFLDDNGICQFFYAEKFDKDNIRLMIADDAEAFVRYDNEEIDNYEFKDYTIMCDVIINKNIFIREFYEHTLPAIENYEKAPSYSELNKPRAMKYLNKIKGILIDNEKIY